MTWDELIRLLSRLCRTVGPGRARTAAGTRVRAHGFIDDYQGVRIARDGTRFRIRARWCGWWWSTARRMGILPLSIPNREIREISDL